MAKASGYIMCDTNILIEYLRGEKEFEDKLKKEIGFENMLISSITEMELVTGARDKEELQKILKEIKGFNVLHLNSEISKLAAGYVKKYFLSHHVDIADALIAASAVYYDYQIYTLNLKHFKIIPNIRLYQAK